MHAEILDVYEAAVLQVQQQVVVAQPCPPTLSSLNYFLSDFKVRPAPYADHLFVSIMQMSWPPH